MWQRHEKCVVPLIFASQSIRDISYTKDKDLFLSFGTRSKINSVISQYFWSVVYRWILSMLEENCEQSFSFFLLRLRCSSDSSQLTCRGSSTEGPIIFSAVLWSSGVSRDFGWVECPAGTKTMSDCCLGLRSGVLFKTLITLKSQKVVLPLKSHGNTTTQNVRPPRVTPWLITQIKLQWIFLSWHVHCIACISCFILTVHDYISVLALLPQLRVEYVLTPEICVVSKFWCRVTKVKVCFLR